MTSRIAATAVSLTVLSLPASAAGQHDQDPSRYIPVEEALRLLTQEGPTPEGLTNRTRPIRDILRQVHGPRPQEELDGLAERLADILLSDTTSRRVRSEVGMACVRRIAAGIRREWIPRKTDCPGARESG